MKPEILLSNGLYYNFDSPDAEVVSIEVIAASLSKQCRFSGHVSRFYSVAEHCYRASFLVPDEDRLEALMHDGAEALVIDVPTPLKIKLPTYRPIEDDAHMLVAEKFGLRFPWPKSVLHADLVMLATEERDLLPPHETWEHTRNIEPDATNLSMASGDPALWERMFLARFRELTR